MSNTKEFKVKDKEGNMVELLVKRPTAQQLRKAQIVYNQAYAEALQSGAIFRRKLESYLKQQNLWDEARQAEYEDITNRIEEGKTKLNAGGIKFSDAKKIALDVKKARQLLLELVSDRTEADSHTVEGQADNTRFNYLVSVCTVYNDSGEPYFSSLDNYLENASTPAAVEAAQNLAALLYGLDSDFEANYPENKFLKEFGLVDEKLRFINKQGKLVDEEGRLIDETGRYINENNEYVDREGNRVDGDGNLIIERKPFLDDDGNPLN